MKRFAAAALIAGLGAGSTQAAVINLPDALGLTGNYQQNNTVADIAGEESVYLISTMTISNPSDEYLFGSLYLETGTVAIGGGQRVGVGNVVGTNDWGVNGAGNNSSGVDVLLDTPTTMVLKINQLTGDWSFWINPDLGAPEGTPDLTGNNVNNTAGIQAVAYRGGRYGAIPVNTNVTDYTNVALYTGDDTPFVPEPTSLALLGLGGLLVARRRRG